MPRPRVRIKNKLGVYRNQTGSWGWSDNGIAGVALWLVGLVFFFLTFGEPYTFILFLFLVIGGAGIVYWHLWITPSKDSSETYFSGSYDWDEFD